MLKIHNVSPWLPPTHVFLPIPIQDHRSTSTRANSPHDATICHVATYQREIVPTKDLSGRLQNKTKSQDESKKQDCVPLQHHSFESSCPPFFGKLSALLLMNSLAGTLASPRSPVIEVERAREPKKKQKARGVLRGGFTLVRCSVLSCRPPNGVECVHCSGFCVYLCVLGRREHVRGQRAWSLALQ